MSLYFEVADISFQLEDISWEQIAPDIRDFIHEAPTAGFEMVRCIVNFVNEFEPLQGIPVYQNPYQMVLMQEDREVRIHFADAFADIFGISEEVDPNTQRIFTNLRRVDMHFLGLLNMERYLLRHDAFILHSCYIALGNDGIAFTAPSGTGKSTQGALWERYGEATVINGDRSIIQKTGQGYRIHSLPFCGSSLIHENVSCILKKIVFVNRDMIDHVEAGNVQQDFDRLMMEITVNRWNKESVRRVLELVEDIFHAGYMVNLFCTPNPEACYRLKEYLYHD